MDEEEIHANVEKPLGAQLYWKRGQSGSGNIYLNEDTGHVEPYNTLSDLEESNTVKKRPCIATALILSLLCVILLTGVVILVFVYTKDNSNWELKMLRLQTSYNNLTEKQHQLQISYNNLAEEKHYLQTSYNNLAEENHQLKTSYVNLTEEKAQLKKKLEDATPDLRRKLQALRWTYFAGKYYYISSMKQTWQDSRNDCLQRGADLEFIRSRKSPTWIGLTDAEKERTWKWVDGTLLGNLRYWAKSEPNNANGFENCAEISDSNLEKSWNDVPCDYKIYWICEVQLI
ncbi:C-type lectin domain family 4 member M-like isoform X2 [Betta splendens]|uniref:C-type lectin domain family 4 member M-like isoform X2 n=1 Tax=Betta splendens TaxID=158456 RepID=A0A6P7NP03_BETSP|nr:C-type lectin domain family 4 member M-like isoform X2 [Betta splendens]